MIVHVALPLPIIKTFSYAVPDNWKPFVKRFLSVRVPFKYKTLTGFIVDMEEGDGANLKKIIEIIDIFPLIHDRLVRLSEWASYYYITPIGLVLKYALPSNLQIEQYLTVRTNEGSVAILNNVPLKKAFHAFGKDTIFRYYSEGLIEFYDLFTGKTFAPFTSDYEPEGKPERILYVGDIKNRLAYYTACISTHLESGKNVLMLLPDYHTTGRYFYQALSEQFQNRVFWYGASMKGKARMETYFRARSEGGLVILGNKSCPFLPIYNNALIIVERQEEDEYRNEKGFKFNAGLLAIQRAEIEHIPIVLGSAAPSMECFKYVEDGEFKLIETGWLKNRTCFEITIGKNIISYEALPEELVNTIKAALEKKVHVAIYTPRKDYSSYIQCLECKKLFLCPLCDGIMSYQKHEDLLICNSCNKGYKYEERCPYCGSKLIHFSHIGTEYLEEKLRHIFTDVQIVKISGETPKQDIKTLKNVSNSAPTIIIGTQILSKLYDLQVNTLILLGWEALRRIGGFRAEEKMFQVLVNLLDALNPEELYIVMERKKRVNPAYFLDFKTFYKEELKKRSTAEFPPYTRLFLIEVEKKSEEAGAMVVKKIKDIIEQEGLTGYMTGPLIKKKKKYRWSIILKGNAALFHKSLSLIYNLPGVHIEADPLYI